MPLIPNLSLYLIQKFDRLALWGNLTILELHFAETQEFESSVISYGNQTDTFLSLSCRGFESSVISYGNQTIEETKNEPDKSLRVV